MKGCTSSKEESSRPEAFRSSREKALRILSHLGNIRYYGTGFKKELEKGGTTTHGSKVSSKEEGAHVEVKLTACTTAALEPTVARHAPASTKVNLVKEVKKERDEIRKDTKKCKRRSRKYRSGAHGRTAEGQNGR
ncbi:hypothetical protein LR48_Vigan748s000100 [Vigna angularis]|uniref:Uncharacterized protein n=1 Tax=Phaseolus angularis TaxID=3914 RepID=A0A0L9TGV4_PHAAN|nr:hypothetical protein LR48_Vigan748s000100 [Vigna angularis]